MTIAKTGSESSSAGNGVSVAFYFPYRFFADTDLKVYVVVNATNASTLQTLTTHYTIVNTGTEAGGTITMVTAPASGETLLIQRIIPKTQSTDYAANDPFPADTHENALDRLTLLTQENESGHITFPDGDGSSPTLDTADSRASRLQGYDSNGNLLTYSLTPIFTAGEVVFYDDYASFKASTESSRGIGAIWNYGPYRGVEVASGDITNSAGTPVQLKVLPNAGGLVSPEQFGDGDSHVEIRACIDFATANGFVATGSGAYTASAALAFTCDADFSGATITHSDPTLAVAIEVRNANVASGKPDYLIGKKIILPHLLTSTFTDETSWATRGEGVRIHNCLQCEIHIPEVYGFQKGVRLAATGNGVSTGCAWNQMYYGKISNNEVNFYADALDAQGWCNENIHWGGRFTHESPVVNTGITGCYHHYIGDTGLGSNSQKFYGPSIEGDNVEFHIYSKDGYCLWDHVRGEAYTLTNMQIKLEGVQARSNIIQIGTTFAKPVVAEISGAKYNIIDYGSERTEHRSSLVSGVVAVNETNFPAYAAVASGVGVHSATYANLVSGFGKDGLFAKADGDTVERVLIRGSDGVIRFGSGSAVHDAFLTRLAAGVIGTIGATKITADAGIGVGNAVSATGLGAQTKVMEVFNSAGASIGYVPIYGSFT